MQSTANVTGFPLVVITAVNHVYVTDTAIVPALKQIAEHFLRNARDSAVARSDCGDHPVVVVAQSWLFRYERLEIIRGHVKIFIVEVWYWKPLHHDSTKRPNGVDINGWVGEAINGSA
jgi:hypothetical protein